MKTRIFIAIRATDDLKRTIARWVEKNKKDYPLVRWLDPDNWHITLIPPWYEDEAGSAKVKLLLSSASGLLDPFDLTFTDISFGPTKKEPRLIWASSEAPQAIIKLKEEIEKALNRPGEKRDFLLHLTIARFRPEKFEAFPTQDLNEAIDWPETASEFQLMRSDLHPDGARYTILQSYAV